MVTERIYRDEFAHEVLRFASRELYKAEAEFETSVNDAKSGPTEEALARLQSREQVAVYWRAIRDAVMDWAIERDLSQPPRLVGEE